MQASSLILRKKVAATLVYSSFTRDNGDNGDNEVKKLITLTLRPNVMTHFTSVIYQYL